MTRVPPVASALPLIAAALVLLLAASCGALSGDTPCTAGNCAGCCAGPDGPCLIGDTPDACGTGAGFCNSCEPRQVCRTGLCDECTAHADCHESTDLCLEAGCESGFGRTYVIPTLSARVPFHASSQGAFVCLYFDNTHSDIYDQGEPVACTAPVANSSNPSWSPGWAVPVYGENMSVWLYIWDDRGEGPVLADRRGWGGATFVSYARVGTYGDDVFEFGIGLQ
jgi:hypothetical protein